MQPQVPDDCTIQKENDIVCKWYVAYTYPKAERLVQDKLERIGLHAFLPMHQVVRNWSDRQKKLTVPLFPNYLFVYSSDTHRSKSLAIREIVRYVSFDGKPATVSDVIINSLKHILNEQIEVDVEQFDQVGISVRVVRGPFAGLEGIMVEKKGKTRLVIQIKVLRNSVSINIAASDVVPIRTSGRY